jgi:HK97 family phage portal protein
MSLLAEVFNPRPLASSGPVAPAYGTEPLSSFWYTSDPSGWVSERGPVGMSADTLLRCGTVYAAVGFRGDSWAMSQPSTFKRTADGREEQPNHPSQIVLRKPNRWQTGNRWRHLNGVRMALWGNAYNEMKGGDRSFADELWPLDPWRCRVVDQRNDGSLLYVYTDKVDGERRLGQERMLRFHDLSTDGLRGVDMYRLIRNIVGIALLAEQHMTTFLTKGTRISGLLVPTDPLEPEQRQQLRDSVNSDLGGASKTGTLGILPYGVKVEKIDTTHRDAQFQELSDGVVGAILRFLRVPGFVVGYQGDKANTYASAKETAQEALRHTVLPIITNVEAEEEKALLPDGSGLQIKHNLDILLRVNTKDRYETLVKATGRPFMTGNEARTVEDMDQVTDDPSMNRVLMPSNHTDGTDPDGEGEETDATLEAARTAQTSVAEARLTAAALTIQKIYLGVDIVLTTEEARAMVTQMGFPLPGDIPGGRKPAAPPPFGAPGAPRPAPAPSGAPEPDEAEVEEDAASVAKRAELLAVQAALQADDQLQVLRSRAARAEWLAAQAALVAVRREMNTAREKAPKLARDAQRWSAWLADLYRGRHFDYLVRALDLPVDVARSWCEAQLAALAGGGLAVMETWETDAAPRLAALVLGEGETRC